MDEVIDLLNQEREKKNLQLSAFLHFDALIKGIDSHFSNYNSSDFELVPLSSILIASLFCGAPVEKWSLVEKILNEVVSPELFQNPNRLKPFLVSLLNPRFEDVLESELNAFSSLDEKDFKKILSVNVEKIIKKLSKKNQAPKTAYLHKSVAVNYCEIFSGLFENGEDKEKFFATKEGMIRGHSFLLLVFLAFDFLKNESESLHLYLTMMDRFNSIMETLREEYGIYHFNGDNSVLLNKEAVIESVNYKKFKDLISEFIAIKGLYFVLPCIHDVLVYAEEHQKDLSKERKKVLKEIQFIDTLIAKYQKKDDFYPVEKELLQLSNLDLQQQILLLLQEKNKRNEQFYEQQLQKYEKSDFGELRSVLLLHGCNPSELTKEEREQLSSLYTPEKLEEAICTLEREEIPWKENYSMIFTSSTVSRIHKIASYVKKKILPIDLLSQNLGFFDVESPLSPEFEKILSGLDSVSINPRDVAKKNDMLFLQDSTNFMERLSLYCKYQVQFTENRENCYDYLEEDRFIDLLDACIEVGMGSYMKQNPYLLSRKNEHFPHGARLLREMGFSFFDSAFFQAFPLDFLSKDKAESYYSSSDFVQVEDDILSKESRRTISNRILNHPVVSMIDSNYLIEEGVYSIGDVLVSRNRFLRNFEVLSLHSELSQEDQMIRSLLYTPYLGYTEEEIKILQKTVCGEAKKISESE